MKRRDPWLVSRRMPFCSLVAAVIAVAAIGVHLQRSQSSVEPETHRAALSQADSEAPSRLDRMGSRPARTLPVRGITTFGDESASGLAPPFEPPLMEMQVFVGYRPFRFDVPSQIGVDASDGDIEKDMRSGMAYRF